MSQYVPSQEDIDRLLDSREEQGFERQVSDPSVLAPIAAFFRPDEETEEPETPDARGEGVMNTTHGTPRPGQTWLAEARRDMARPGEAPARRAEPGRGAAGRGPGTARQGNPITAVERHA